MPPRVIRASLAAALACPALAHARDASPALSTRSLLAGAPATLDTGLDARQDDALAGSPSPFYSEHSGYYVRLSGLVVDQQNDVIDLDTDDRFGFQTGGGLSAGVGFRYPSLPVALEFEYAFRTIGTEDELDDGRLNLHTLAANVLFDASDLVGPVGLYAGAGVGVRIDRLSYQSSGGSGQLGIDGEGFYWQALAGATVSVAREVQLFAGVRWTDAGNLEEDNFRLDSEALNYEFGFRVFF